MRLLNIVGSYSPLLAGVALAIGCGSNTGNGSTGSGDQQNGGAPFGGSGAFGGSGNVGNFGGSGNVGNFGGSGNVGNFGGSGNVGNFGGSGNVGNFGGSGAIGGTNPGGGTNPSGGTNPGGGTGPSSGGESPGGAGGGSPGGAGGTAGGGNGGSAGGTVTLGHCDQGSETSAMPIEQPCGDITTVSGTNLKLGQYGASMDVNVGKGFENTDPNDNATCPAFVAIFNEDPKISQQLLDVGTQPCTATAPNTGSCLDMKLYSVYRPAIWPDGKIPVLSWGNGTCAQPEGYGPLLRYIASQGFFIVAANSREVGGGTEIRHGLDFAAAANMDSTSPYFGHLDMTKVGVMGHSQGSAGAAAAASDSRVQDVILFNAGDTAVKPYLAVSGDLDITGYTAAQMSTAINGQPKAAYLFFHNPAGMSADGLRGHLVLMLTPDRVAPAAASWWQMVLENDATAKNQFVGSSCGLCGHSSDYDFGEHGL